MKSGILGDWTQYVLRGSIKFQALVVFLVEFITLVEDETPLEWTLSIDDVSNMKVNDTYIILEESGNILIEQALKFEFKANNNHAEYEALIFGMVLALEMNAYRLKAKIL